MEVAYSETLDHVEESLRYWLSPGRAHDCIIVKIDPVPQGQVPVRMRVSYSIFIQCSNHIICITFRDLIYCRLGITVSQQVEEQEI